MGTRNLTMVIDQNGNKKVAQYGQWDGYPSGVGKNVLEFVKNKELLDKLKTKLSVCRFLDYEKDKEFIESYQKNAPEWSNDPDNRTAEQIRWFDTYITRNLSEEVLTNIANSEDSEILLRDSEESGKGDGWVEWSYVIDLQKNELLVYTHIDEPIIAKWSLSELPEEKEFIKKLEYQEEEE